MKDTVNAFMDYPFVPVGNGQGPLSGMTLAVKDIYDVAGYKTGCGSPEKLEEAPVAKSTAPSIQKLIEAGAEFIGKTKTDELAYSLNGDNVHYPQPINPAAPGRLTGGSSSGSAAAVAAGLVDIATGSDTGGSIRAPASYCGLIGLRATHGRMSLENTMPLAESFDTFGWFTKTAEQYQAVSDVMLGTDDVTLDPKRILIAEDCLTLLMGIEEARAMDPAIEHISSFADTSDVTLADGDMENWYWTFRKIQAFEAWAAHGEWIEKRQPKLGPGVKERFEFAKTVTIETFDEASATRAAITRHVEEILGDDGILALPTVPSIAPKLETDFQWRDDFRNRALQLLCVSGLTGLPQLTLPMVTFEQCPLGVSVISPRGTDRQLVDLGLQILKSF